MAVINLPKIPMHRKMVGHSEGYCMMKAGMHNEQSETQAMKKVEKQNERKQAPEEETTRKEAHIAEEAKNGEEGIKARESHARDTYDKAHKHGKVRSTSRVIHNRRSQSNRNIILKQAWNKVKDGTLTIGASEGKDNQEKNSNGKQGHPIETSNAFAALEDKMEAIAWMRLQQSK